MPSWYLILETQQEEVRRIYRKQLSSAGSASSLKQQESLPTEKIENKREVQTHWPGKNCKEPVTELRLGRRENHPSANPRTLGQWHGQCEQCCTRELQELVSSNFP